MGLLGLWIGLTVAMLCTSTAGGLIILWADWDREMEKVVERLKGDKNSGGDGESTEGV